MQHPKCCTKNLSIFKFDPTSSNMLQHIATGWPNACNILCSTMLQNVSLKCWSVWPGLITYNVLHVSEPIELIEVEIVTVFLEPSCNSFFQFWGIEERMLNIVKCYNLD